MRIAKEMIVGLRYKLRMFGVPIDGPANVYCDNQGVVKNTSLPESTLSKKHNAINYHAVREACAAGIVRVAKEPMSRTTYRISLLDRKSVMRRCCPSPVPTQLSRHQHCQDTFGAFVQANQEMS